jgi:hypothetical protein
MASRLIFLHHRVSVISEGGTEKGKQAGCWMSRFKPVGGERRQIHAPINAER